MIRRSETTVLSDGVTPQPGVYVAVKDYTGELATIYDDAGEEKSNPLLSGVDGGFYYNILDSATGAFTEEYRLSALGSPRTVRAVYLSPGEGVGPKGDPGSAGEGHPTRTAMAGVAATNFDDAYLSEVGRQGKFAYSTANLSTNVTADSLQGIYVPPASDPTGASGAWVRQFEGPANIEWFGAKPISRSPGFDSQPSIQAAVNYMSAIGGGPLIFRGAYITNSQITWKSGVSLLGHGSGVSKIQPVGTIFSAIANTLTGPAGGGDPTVVPLVDCHFADFEIDNSGLTSTASSVSGKGFFILYMRRCSFRNIYVHDTIGTAFGCDFLDQVVFHGCVAERAGRNWDGSVGGGQSGFGIGTGWQAREAVTVSDCHAIDCGNYGFFVETQEGSSQTVFPYGARFVNCIADGCRIGFGNKGSGGTLFSGCDGINNAENGFALSQGAYGDRMIGCDALNNGAVGILVLNYRGKLNVIGCNARNNVLQGINIDASGTPTVPTECHILGGQYETNGRSGVLFKGSTLGITGWSLRSATVKNNGTALTSGQRYGVLLTGILTDGVIQGNWIGNDSVSTSQTEAVRGVSTTLDQLEVMGNTIQRTGVANQIVVVGTGVRVNGNPGYNPKSTATVLTATASPWAYTAGVSDEMVYLTGTGIQCNMQGVVLFDGATTTSVRVPANETLTVTYTTITRARSMRM